MTTLDQQSWKVCVFLKLIQTRSAAWLCVHERHICAKKQSFFFFFRSPNRLIRAELCLLFFFRFFPSTVNVDAMPHGSLRSNFEFTGQWLCSMVLCLLVWLVLASWNKKQKKKKKKKKKKKNFLHSHFPLGIKLLFLLVILIFNLISWFGFSLNIF